tara:strand:+ start:749 stop:1009 length:261 start_codon:yes stop_codon:yes gene_type:complete
MKVPKGNEDMIKNNKKFVLDNMTKIHTNLVFQNETTLDFDEYIIALAMIPLTFEEQANMRGMNGMQELMQFLAAFLQTIPVKEEYK